MQKLSLVLPAVAVVALLIACGSEPQDVSRDLETSFTPAEVLADGGVSCQPSQVLICHVPPGNAAAAHSICVGAPAVKAHLAHHDDTLGACPAADAGADAGTDGGTDAGVDGGSDAG